MSTFGNLIADVDQSVRETTTEKNAFLLASAGRIYQRLLRMDNWPQARTPGQVITIVNGTQAYDLPPDFDRYAGDRVNYNPFNGTTLNAYSLPIIQKGSHQDDTRASIWEGVAGTNQVAYPRVVGVQAGGTNTYQLIVYPLAGSSGDTITFDYYAVPQRSEITTASVISVDALYEALFNYVAADYARFINDQLSFQVFTQTAKDEHRIARQTLSRL